MNSSEIVPTLVGIAEALANNPVYNAPPVFAHAIHAAASHIEAQDKLIAELRGKLQLLQARFDAVDPSRASDVYY